jgi:PPP family 3-phenylpropionic acid transporter
LLWAIGVLCEIVMFWRAPGLVRRFGAYRLMSACLVVTALRWWLVAVAGGSFGWMALAQVTHAISFAVFHAGCMRRMAELFPARRDMAAAQGMLYGISGGIGGVLGAGVAALAWQHGGGKAAFVAGAIATLLALVLHLTAARFAKANVPP